MKQDLCVVCGEQLDEVNCAVCGACGGRFHLVMRTTQPGKDCGDVWINEAYLALQYACSNCLHPESAPGGQRGSSGETPHRPTRARRARGPRIRRRYRKR